MRDTPIERLFGLPRITDSLYSFLLPTHNLPLAWTVFLPMTTTPRLCQGRSLNLQHSQPQTKTPCQSGHPQPRQTCIVCVPVSLMSRLTVRPSRPILSQYYATSIVTTAPVHSLPHQMQHQSTWPRIKSSRSILEAASPSKS